MLNKLLEKISGKWIFFIIVVVIYMVLALVDLELAKNALIEFLKLIKKILPIFVLVFILMFISALVLDFKKVAKYVGKEAGIKGWFIAIILGILSMGPIYMWYPLLSDLKEKGMKNSFIAAFLYNRAVKIPLIPMMIYYFGLSFTIILTFYMIVFSVINGVAVNKLIKK
ncbi:unnamed protein product [marine sediment metagenome]|uniref:Permease n=1 Tax=marine sediment metagenome TaxID=412755 RepID=X0U579_9ZZZZ